MPSTRENLDPADEVTDLIQPADRPDYSGPPQADNIISLTRAFARYLRDLEERLDRPDAEPLPGREHLKEARIALLKVGIPKGKSKE